jgi:hypothetical protein
VFKANILSKKFVISAGITFALTMSVTAAAAPQHASMVYSWIAHPFARASAMEDPSMHMVESDANALSIGAKTVLPRDGWTVTASDSQTTYPATNVLDGNNATIWHSNYATTPNRPLTHWM